MARVLIVDDDQGMRDLVEILLTREGHNVKSAAGGREALNVVKKHKFDLVLTDLKMPQVDGIDVLKQIKESSPETIVILMTAYASRETALAAMREGAYDYLEKNFDIEDLKQTVEDALKRKGIHDDEMAFRKEVEDAVRFGNIIGKSREMLKVYSLIKKVADTTANVLILGESGTGKELVAAAIHKNSPRRDKPFVVINCGGIPENLLESEFFGYMKGSFTGAYADKPGLFETAGGGTVFLDEIGELPAALQVKLLRIVQEKTFRRIGGAEDLKVDVRIISATNQDLNRKVRAGSFREDLFYRLNVIPIDIPPLRKRKEDIPVLVRFFIDKYSKEFGKEIKKISDYALELLMDYPFPGNVRELENIIERSVTLETTNIILPENLILSDSPFRPEHADGFPENGVDLNSNLMDYERALIKKALEKAKGSKTRAAELLKISFPSLRHRLERLGINYPKE